MSNNRLLMRNAPSRSAELADSIQPILPSATYVLQSIDGILSLTGTDECGESLNECQNFRSLERTTFLARHIFFRNGFHLMASLPSFVALVVFRRGF